MAKKALKYMRIAVVAEQLGVARQTLQSAWQRGEIAGVETACGLPLLDPGSAAQWVSRADERSPGRKPAAAKERAVNPVTDQVIVRNHEQISP